MRPDQVHSAKAAGSYGESTALIVVDVQNDFADPGGNLYVRGGGDLVPRINAEIAAARDAGALVVYTQDWHPETTPHFERDGGTWPVHCVAGTWGAEFHPELVIDGPVVRKGTGGEDGYSGFSVRHPESGEEYATELGDILARRGIERVYVLGLAQDVCVKETVLDALRYGYRTVLISDATLPVEARNGEQALREMADAGAAIR